MAEGRAGQLPTPIEGESGRVWALDDELLTLLRNTEVAWSTSQAAEEALAEERRVAPERVKEAIFEYKKSPWFKLGLARSGQVTYEFGYRVTLARFRMKYLDMEVDSTPSPIFLRTRASGCQTRFLLMIA